MKKYEFFYPFQSTLKISSMLLKVVSRVEDSLQLVSNTDLWKTG